MEQRLLRWRPDPVGPVHSIGVVVDPDDFDVDPETEERYPRILGFDIAGSPKRGAEFAWGCHDYLKWPRYIIPSSDPRFLPVPPRRVTMRGFCWDFTPDHVPVFPGSVSVPSLLTSGGAQTITNMTTATISPTGGALLIIAMSTDHNQTHAQSDTFTGSGAWAQVGLDNSTTLHHSQAYCQLGASPGSGAITETFSISSRNAWVVAEVTGHNAGTPASESNTGTASLTTLDIALADIAVGNRAIGTIGLRGDEVVAGTDETELLEVGSTGANPVLTQMEYGVAATVNWTWTGNGAAAGVAIEYAQALLGGNTVYGAGSNRGSRGRTRFGSR